MRSWREAKRAQSTSPRFCARSCRWRRILRARRPGRIVDSGQARQERERRLFCPWARFPSRAGRHQPHRQRLLLFRTRRRRTRCARTHVCSAESQEGKKLVGHVVITVDDDGPGIPPHALERIFERFYTDRPSQGFGQNSGLGLSISRQIVEAHGGRDLGLQPAGRIGQRSRRIAGNATIPMRRRGMAPARALSSNFLRSRHDWRRFGRRG